MRRNLAGVIVVVVGLLVGVAAQAPKPPAKRPATRPAATPAGPAGPFTTPLTAAQMAGKQAVLETAMGTIVIDLLPEQAPNHVGLFIKTAQEGGYDGTAFHRVIRQGIVQGGDPLTRDPGKAAQYGTGGLNLLKAEISPTAKHTRGAVSAVIVPGKPDSAGTQFFICIVDQPALDGQYTIFGRVSQGLNVAQKISELPADEKGAPGERVAVTKVTIRDRPPEVPEAFSTESVADLAAYRAVLETSLGDITVEFRPDRAPGHVRNFLRLAQAGVYDGMTWHRVVKGFVIQSGHLPTRKAPLDEPQLTLVRTLPAEFNDIPHETGVLSMARLGNDENSAQSSFFIVTARSAILDGKYSAFGHVVAGLDVVAKIENVPVNGETPVEEVELRRVRVEKR
jgi:peptidyl-prolyl cis-trans isomerase B (cyclophilin B)